MSQSLPETDAQAKSLLLKGPVRSAVAFLDLYEIKRGHGMGVAEAYEATLNTWNEIYLEKEDSET